MYKILYLNLNNNYFMIENNNQAPKFIGISQYNNLTKYFDHKKEKYIIFFYH